MNSFTINAIGNLAETPKLEGEDDSKYTKFALIGNDYAGRDKEDITTSVYFVAFGSLAEAIANNARKGDQLILEAQMRSNNYKDKKGEVQYSYSHIVQGFRFGAPGKIKRKELEDNGK